uniref:Serpin domain-containing protein n=1 Tax=Chelydra serpentina TaxID=8475 RepID=A0A8C3TCV8_CHESE
MDSLSASNGSFTLDLFKKLNESLKGKNIFFSPWSISSALAMTYVGAKGNTATQMAEVVKVLYFDIISLTFILDSISLYYYLKFILYTVETIKLKQSTSILLKWKMFMHSKPLAVLPWNKNTILLLLKGKIQNLLPKGAVDPNTALVLVNAIYFKGKWEKRFLNENTSENPFRLSKTKTKPVQMMFLKDTFPICYLETMKVKIAELPYVNNDLSMLILLPDDIEDKSTGLEQDHILLSARPRAHQSYIVLCR